VHPIGRMGEPDDVAWAVVHLAPDESKFVTGSEFVALYRALSAVARSSC
jgi:NAD(P)-dependent dehydrogenase (short-subunit alcohol dehydrogenase family)